MAYGVIKLSKKTRKLITIGITIINLLQIVIGLILFITGVYVTRSVGPKIFSERAEITFVFTVIGMYGVNVMLQYFIGLHMCYKCYTKAHKKSTSSLLFMWSLAACNTVLNGIVLAALAIKTSKHIVRSIRHSLKRGIGKYLKDLTWKFTIDHLQQYSECCGIESSKDWTSNDWIIPEYLSTKDSKLEKANGSSLNVLPWSCCRVNYPLPCFHDEFQQPESSMVYKNNPDIVVNSIYGIGCLEVLRTPIERGLITVIIADTTLLFLQTIAVILFRLLYTSSKNAIILGDEDAVAPGWIVGPSHLNYASELLSIMHIENETESETRTELPGPINEAPKVEPVNDIKRKDRHTHPKLQRNKNGSISIIPADLTVTARAEYDSHPNIKQLREINKPVKVA